ncbi:MAG: DUF4344 domain-containing metallopeptidase [Leptolyngbyaceae cyanobacterium]
MNQTIKHRLLKVGIGLGILSTAAVGYSNIESNIKIAGATEPTEDNGDFIVSYQQPEESSHQKVLEALKETQFYDDLAESLNQTFALPQDLMITFRSCDEANAWYEPEWSEIVLCYDLFKHYANIAPIEEQGDYATEIIYAGLFTAYHELGHALVDLYELPITGQEEDAVDEFAAILLLEDEDYDAVIAGIDQFDLDAVEEAESDEEIPFWGEHSLSDQRSYNIACLTYGSNPSEFYDWVADDILPEERAEFCPEEYEQAQNTWNILLEPYLL